MTNLEHNLEREFQTPEDGKFILDSATRPTHLTHPQCSMTTPPHPTSTLSANGNFSPITKQRPITIPTTRESLRLSNAIHYPKICRNLLSIAYITAQYGIVSFTPCRAAIIRPHFPPRKHDVVATASLVCNQYLLDTPTTAFGVRTYSQPSSASHLLRQQPPPTAPTNSPKTHPGENPMFRTSHRSSATPKPNQTHG